MAILRFGPIADAVRGTIGGTTFSANKSGPYVKAWSTGSLAPTPLRVAQQARLSALPQEWRSLAQALRDAWDTWAALPAQELTNSLGEAYFIPGFNWFIKANIQTQIMGRVLQMAVPTIARPTIPSINALNVRVGDVNPSNITYPTDTFVPNFDLVLYLAMSNSTAAAAFPNAPKLVHVNQNPSSNFDEFQDGVEEAFGNIQENRKWFAYLVRATIQGLTSPPALFSALTKLD